MGQIVDTNAQEVGRFLPNLGIGHRHRQTVGDNLERIVDALQLAFSRSDIVITIGGLGPTGDDLTREGIAGALGVPLQADTEIEEKLRKLFAYRNIPWTDRQLKQALVPAGGQPIENPNGSAPGLCVPFGDKIVFALPGPRGEFLPMLHGFVQDYLREHYSDGVIVSKFFKVARIGESIVEDKLRDLMDAENPSLAPYASPGEVTLRLSAHAPTAIEAETLLAPAADEIRARLGVDIFAEGMDNLESAVITLLIARGLSVATGESMTGGGLCERLTSVAGSSGVVRGGIVAYQPPIKQALLGVPESHLDDVVSEEVALDLARGAREKLGADFGVGITGNAGPTSDVGGKPVGLVYIAIVGPIRERVEEYRYRSHREDIRRRCSQSALTLLREEILAIGRV